VVPSCGPLVIVQQIAEPGTPTDPTLGSTAFAATFPGRCVILASDRLAKMPASGRQEPMRDDLRVATAATTSMTTAVITATPQR
jgi:hypothetical protein